MHLLCSSSFHMLLEFDAFGVRHKVNRSFFGLASLTLLLAAAASSIRRSYSKVRVLVNICLVCE